MIVVALAVALVGSLLVVPTQNAQAATGIAIELVGDRVNNNCSARVVAVNGSSVDIRSAGQVASRLGWRASTGPNGQSVYESLKTACTGGDHRRILQSGISRTFIGVAAGIAVAAATSIALPDLIIGGFAAVGITLTRALAVAVSQCIGWGVGALVGEITSGAPVSNGIAAAAVSCFVGGIGGFVKELDSVRRFFAAIGSSVVGAAARYVQTGIAACRGVVAGFQRGGITGAVTSQGFATAVQQGLELIRVAGTRV